jgi:precorrin-8X/cobalt-precorrin-8 methylmutase
VGSQALTGIPMVHACAATGGVCGRSTGFTPTLPAADAVVVAEVWPSTVPPGPELPKDHGQVLALARHFATLDDAGELGTLFAACVPASEAAELVDEEGWVLGAMFQVHQDDHDPLET